MAKKSALAFPYAALEQPLASKERRALTRHLRALLAWQASLRRWPALSMAPAATPFVSIHAKERLVGCFGTDEGEPGERVSRAFLRALADTRHHVFDARDRPALLAHVAYPFAPFAVDPDREEGRIEPGAHGLAYVGAGRSAILLPSVACDGGYDARALLDRLAAKAGLAREQLGTGRVFAFLSETVAGVEPTDRPSVELGLDWLAGLVDERGAVTFSIDPRKRSREAVGRMHHARVAIAVSALAQGRRHARLVERARTRLGHDLDAALSGRATPGWPDEPNAMPATIALARLAGAGNDAMLDACIARTPSLRDSAWYAAQCVVALGKRAPLTLWQACVRDLERQPWAPWTLLAARARDDAQIVARCAPALIASLRADPPSRGGCTVTAIPELALTAITVEALRGLETKSAQRAVGSGRTFLRRWQVTPSTLLSAHAPEIGAFPLSPIVYGLRVDVTAHAVLALSD